MPEVYDSEIRAVPEIQTVDEQVLVAGLFAYTEEKQNPWRMKYHRTLKECYDFVELNQWDGPDMALLALTDTPSIPIDRIGRNLDVIEGISLNTGNTKKVVKREMGDERCASILDDLLDEIAYNGGFSKIRAEARKSMLHNGIGVRKIGFDPTMNDGEIWAENVNTEDFRWSKCKSKELEDGRWFVEESVMDWEDAMLINPAKAPQLKSLKTTLQTAYAKLDEGRSQGALSKDYQAEQPNTSTSESYPDQVKITTFWLKHRTPYQKVSFLQMVPMTLPNGQSIDIPQPKVSQQPLDYKLGEGEQLLGHGIQEYFDQFIVAGGDAKSGILLKTAQADDHPYVGMCAERKKNGQPFGFVERVIPFQKRKNIAWAQKVAFNNKSIKSPIVIEGGNPEDAVLSQQSSFGSILRLKVGEKLIQVNLQPGVNLQAIEEGEAADRDMDFAASAGSQVLTGSAGSSSSGIQLIRQQDAAITPLNKWVSAESDSELVFNRKVLKLAIKYYPPDKMARIVGLQKFYGSLGYVPGPDGQPVPNMQPDVMGNPPPPPVPLPLTLDIVHYDVKIEDKSVSDFNKQQSFNAAIELKNTGTLFDDEFMIRNAPLKDVDAAIESNRLARQDMIRNLMMQVEILKAQLGEAQKMIPKNPTSQGGKGKAAPQGGKRSMMGGETLGMG